MERLQLLRGAEVVEWVVADAVQGQVLGAFDDQAVLAAVAVYTSSGF